MSLQWTIRDKDVVNLPTVLLVKGDIICLRPGQAAPARCKELVVRIRGLDKKSKVNWEIGMK